MNIRPALFSVFNKFFLFSLLSCTFLSAKILPEDSLAVRAILDKNNLADIAVTSVVEYFKRPYHLAFPFDAKDFDTAA